MKNESGVSSVVGVVLLLLLVIVASSIMAVVLSTATNEAVDSTPNAMFTISDDPQILYHGGGDVLYKNRLVFYNNGAVIPNIIEIDSVDTWTEWHTGQAIKLPSGNHVENLTIIALDSLGRQQLLYKGSAVVWIPLPTYTGTRPTIPPPTTTPTSTPTPKPMPNAAFTLTSVILGENISLNVLPSTLVNSANYLLLIGDTWVEGEWVTGWHWWTILWIYGEYQLDGHWEKYADVEFTAVEAGAAYSWSSTGPNSTVVDLTSNPARVKFNSPGDYTITLAVTNSSGTSLSTKNISVRNPGLTTLTWIKHDGWSDHGLFGVIYYYPSFNANNHINSNYKWDFSVDASSSSKTNNNNYNLVFKLNSNSDSVKPQNIILTQNIWYHVTGTLETNTASNNLNIYVNGSNKGTKTTPSSLAYTTPGVRYFDETNHFIYNHTMFYEIPFALTPAEITSIYNAEKILF